VARFDIQVYHHIDLQARKGDAVHRMRVEVDSPVCLGLDKA